MDASAAKEQPGSFDEMGLRLHRPGVDKVYFDLHVQARHVPQVMYHVWSAAIEVTNSEPSRPDAAQDPEAVNLEP